MDMDIKKVLRCLDKLKRKVKEQAEVIWQLDEMFDNHSETITKIPGCCCAKDDGCLLLVLAISSSSFTEYGLISWFRFESPEPLVHDSDHDAEGVTDLGTDLSYVTPPMQGASPLVPDSTLLTMEESPAEDRLDEAGTLVPIQETNEVEVEEVLMAPEENEEPIPMREQPSAY